MPQPFMHDHMIHVHGGSPWLVVALAQLPMVTITKHVHLSGVQENGWENEQKTQNMPS